jgi:hypothetical protein
MLPQRSLTVRPTSKRSMQTQAAPQEVYQVADMAGFIGGTAATIFAMTLVVRFCNTDPHPSEWHVQSRLVFCSVFRYCACYGTLCPPLPPTPLIPGILRDESNKAVSLEEMEQIGHARRWIKSVPLMSNKVVSLEQIERLGCAKIGSGSMGDEACCFRALITSKLK